MNTSMNEKTKFMVSRTLNAVRSRLQQAVE